MANKKHLQILLQNSKAKESNFLKHGFPDWNEWRKKHPGTAPDLKHTDLKFLDLSGIDLSGVDLRWSSLSGANLKGANLNNADLRWVDLSLTDLLGANLKKAKISDSILVGADFRGANLSDVDFSHSDLRDTDFRGATLTGACLYGTARFKWKIEGITCDYIFFDLEGKQRQPKNNDFEQNEFEYLYKSIPTVEIVFSDGITLLDPLVLNFIARSISEKHPDWNLQLLSLENRGYRGVAKFGVNKEKHIDEARELITVYKQQINELQKEKNIINFEKIELAERYKNLTEEMLSILKKWLEIPKEMKVLNGGNYFELNAHNDININISQVSETIEQIKKVVEKEPDETFSDKPKQKIVEYLDFITKNLAKDGVKEAGSKIFEMAKTDLAPILAKISSQLHALSNLCGF